MPQTALKGRILQGQVGVYQGEVPRLKQCRFDHRLRQRNMRSVTASDSPQKESKKAEQRRTETQPTEHKNREKSVLRSHRALFHFGCRPLSLRFGESKQHFP